MPEVCSLVSSPLGDLLLISQDECLTGLYLPAQGKQATGKCTDDLPVFKQASDWLSRYFNGEQPRPGEIPIRLKGTGFQQAVWQALMGIPYGQAVCYLDIAKQVYDTPEKARAGARAVGGAIGKNPLSILIPCHRVVGKDGRLTGYAGGLAAKTWLLRHEGVLPEGL